MKKNKSEVKWTDEQLVSWFAGTAQMTKIEHADMMLFRDNREFRIEALKQAIERGLAVQLRDEDK